MGSDQAVVRDGLLSNRRDVLLSIADHQIKPGNSMTDSIVRVFNFNGTEIPVFGTPENPLWIAKHICDELDLGNVSKAVERLEDYQKADITTSDISSQTRTYKGITEAGLYELVMTSRKDEAKDFKRWVCEEVLPTIRKTGQYQISSQLVEPKSLPETREQKLSIIQQGIDILNQLGGADEHTEILLKDYAKNILLEAPMLTPAGYDVADTERMLIPVSDRVLDKYGKRLGNGMLSAIGRKLASRYRQLNEGNEPPHREQFVDGATRKVKCYRLEHYEEFGDLVIESYLLAKGLLDIA